MGLNASGIGFTFSAQDKGVGDFFTGLKSSVVSAGKQLGDFASKASDSTSALGTSGSALKNVNSELIVFDRAAFNAAKVAGDFTDALSPERIDPGRDSMGRFTKHLYGFSKASNKAGKEFEDTSDSISEGTKAGTKSLQVMGEMASKLKDILGQLKVGNLMAAFDLSGLGAVKEALGGLTQGGGQLTTSFESQAAGVAKSARSIAANMGLTGSELREFQKDYAGLVTGAEVGEEAAKKSLMAWKTNAKDFQAIGFTNKKSLAFFADMGVNVDQLSDVLRKTRKTFGFADADLKSLTSSAAAFGKQTGDVSGAMNMLPEIVEQLGNVTDSMGNKLKGADLAKFGRETFTAASGFQQLGYSAEDAKKAALALGESLIKGRKDYSGLFTGVNSEFPKFLTSLSISTGTAQDAFTLMNEGPEGFMKGMAQLAGEVKARGGDVNQMMRLMQDHMVEALGPEAGKAMVDFMGKADEATLKMMSSTKRATVDLEKMANESHQGSRTLAESFEMAEQSFITSFRNIGRKEAVQFVQDTTKQFGVFTQKMNEVAEGDGPLAGIVQQFSLMHQIGAKALLPESLRPIATIMGTMGSELVPLLGALGAMGLKFSMLASPIALLAIPIAILVIRFADLMMQGKSVGQAFEQIGNDIINFGIKVVIWVDKALDSLLNFATGWFKASKKLDFTAFFSNLLGGLKGGGKGMGPALAAFGADLMQGIGDALSGKDPKTKSRLAGIISNLIGAIANTFKALVKGMDASGLGSGIVDFLKAGFLFALTARRQILDAIPWTEVTKGILDLLGQAFKILSGPAVGGFMGEIGKALGDNARMLGSVLLRVVSEALDWLSKADLSGWISGMLDNLLGLAVEALSGIGDLVGQVLSKLPEWAPKIQKTILTLLSTLPGMLGETLSGLGDKVGPIFTKVFKAAVIAIGQLFSNPEFLDNIKAAVPKILDGLSGLMAGAIDLLKKLALGAVEGIMEGLVALFPEYAGPITAVFEVIVKRVSDHFDSLKMAFKVVFAVLKFGFELVAQHAKALWEGVKILWGSIVRHFNLLKAVGTAVWGAISAAAALVWAELQLGWESVVTTVTGVVTSIQTTWDNFVLGFTITALHIAEYVLGVYSSIKNTVTGFLDNLSEGWRISVEYVGTLWQSFKTWFTEMWPGITEVIGKVWGWISNTIGMVWDSIKSAGKSVAKGMSDVWQNMMNGIKIIYDFVIEAVNEMKIALSSLSGDAPILLDKMDVTPAVDTLTEFTDEANKGIEISPFVLSPDAKWEGAFEKAAAGLSESDRNALATRMQKEKSADWFNMGPSSPDAFVMPKVPALSAPTSTFTTGRSASQMGPVPGVPPAHWEQDSAKAIASYTAVVNAAAVMRAGLNTTYTGISTDSALAFKTANIAIDKLMTEGLVGTFKKTWKTILTTMPKEFFEPYKVEWKKWVDELVKVFGEGIIRMLDAMILATAGMKADAASVAVDVNQMTAALQTLLAAKAKAAEEEKARADAEVSELPEAAGLSDDLKLLSQAINDPLWWTSYKALFNEKMEALLGAVNMMKAQQTAAAPAGGASAAAKTKIGPLTGQPVRGRR